MSNDAGRAGERRQLWARDTHLPDGSPLVFIEPGGARRLRPDCQAGRLICPVPGCDNPRYTTRGGSRRDSFAHTRAPQDPNHAPERWFHLLAKQQIGEWLRSQAPDAEVHVDHHAVDNGQIPDVLARFPDGRRFAFEVQYSPMTAEAWLRRHHGYREQSVTDVWLFGHIPPHLRRRDSRSRDGEPWFVLTALHQAVRIHDSVVRWIDPDSQVIYSLQRDAHQRGAWDTRHTNPGFRVEADALTDCRVEGPHFSTPSDKRLADDEQQRQDETERKRTEQQARRAEHNGADVDVARRHQAEEWRRKRDAQKAVEWQRLVPQLVQRFGGVPAIIEEHCRLDWSYQARYPPLLRSSLFLTCIQGQVGSTFTFKQALQRLAAQPEKNMPGLRASLTAYLRKLRDEGFVSFDMEGGWIGHIRVCADLPEQQGHTEPASHGAPPGAASRRVAADMPTRMLRAAAASIENGARRCGLGSRVIPQADGGGVRCLVGSNGQLSFMFEVLLDGPLARDEMRRRSAIVRERGARAVWIALHANLASATVETPCFPLRPHGAPDIEVRGGVVTLEEAVVGLITAPDRTISLYVDGGQPDEADAGDCALADR
ncbi:MAG TPA: competence protein CoiA family protein [Chloroflexota bacterium]